MFYAADDCSRVKLIDFGSAEDFSCPEIRKLKIDDNYKRSQHALGIRVRSRPVTFGA